MPKMWSLAFIVPSINRTLTAPKTSGRRRYAIDSWGLRGELLWIASVLYTASHIMFAFPSIPPFSPLVMIGSGYSIVVNTVWPTLPLLVPEEKKATAISIMRCFQNLGLTLAPLVRAFVYDHSDEHYVPGVSIFFTAWSSLAVAATTVLYFADRWSGNRLHLARIWERRRDQARVCQFGGNTPTSVSISSAIAGLVARMELRRSDDDEYDSVNTVERMTDALNQNSREK
eukprot:scaffold162_cov176-Amphora_coffeaeformis.AAC.47